MLLKALHQQAELFGLRRVHPLVDRVQNFLCLLDHGKRGANRSVCPALAHLILAGAADALAGQLDGLRQRHKTLPHILVGQRHDCLRDRHAAGLDQCAAAGRDAEDVGVLTRASIGHEKAGEVGVHASIEHFAPSSRQCVGSIAKYMQQANIVKTHARHKSILNKVCARFGQFFIIFVIVANNGQDLLG